MRLYYIVPILFLLLGAVKGVKDNVMFHCDGINPATTWTYKYARNEAGNFLPYVASEHWWYFGIDFNVAYKEKFPLSATWLVALTDPWHKWDWVERHLTYAIVIVMLMLAGGAPVWASDQIWTWSNFKQMIAMSWLILLLAYIASHIGFHLTYTWFARC